jgi:hypothetical protein
MDRTMQRWQIPEGADVIGADGDKVGTVVATDASYVIVEKGFFFPTDYYVPLRAIANFDGDKVHLTVTKNEALNQEWGQPPATGIGDDRVVTGTVGTDAFAGRAARPTADEGDPLVGITPTGIAEEHPGQGD